MNITYLILFVISFIGYFVPSFVPSFKTYGSLLSIITAIDKNILINSKNEILTQTSLIELLKNSFIKAVSLIYINKKIIQIKGVNMKLIKKNNYQLVINISAKLAKKYNLTDSSLFEIAKSTNGKLYIKQIESKTNNSLTASLIKKRLVITIPADMVRFYNLTPGMEFEETNYDSLFRISYELPKKRESKKLKETKDLLSKALGLLEGLEKKNIKA